MLLFVNIKVFFFLMDLISAICYMRFIIHYSLYKYLILTIILSPLCLATSFCNIILIINHINLNLIPFIDNYYTFCSHYIIIRFCIYLLEWSIYIIFLLAVKQTYKFTDIVITMIVLATGAGIIYSNYWWIEFIENDILHITQYISPIELML